MSIHEYVVCRRDGLWEVWLGDRLLSGHPTRMHATEVANMLATKRAVRGETTVVLVRATNGRSVHRSTRAHRVGASKHSVRNPTTNRRRGCRSQGLTAL